MATKRKAPQKTEPQAVAPEAPAAAPEAPRVMAIPGEILIDLMEHGIAGMERRLAAMNVPPGVLAEFHMNRAALLLAGLDEPVARGRSVGELTAKFGDNVERFHARMRAELEAMQRAAEAGQ